MDEALAPARRPQILGILNLSPDSFSDGGRYSELDAARAHADALIRGGAALVDVGAVSSNPDSTPVSSDDEIARLDPVLTALHDRGIESAVDTFSPATQQWVASHAARLGVRMLNDIRGFPAVSEQLVDAVNAAGLDLVVMHAVQRGPADRRSTDPAQVLDGVFRFFDERLDALVSAGIPEDRLIVDPGMGFFLGATPGPSVAVLRALTRLRARYGRPIYISVSRKSFLGALLGGRSVEDRGLATALTELWAVLHHDVDYVRTHDPAALSDVLTLWTALSSEASPGV